MTAAVRPMDERQPTGSTGARTPTRQLCGVRPVTRRGRDEDPEPFLRRGEPRGPAALRPPDRPGRLVHGAGGRQVARRVGHARCEVAERLLYGFEVVLLRGGGPAVTASRPTEVLLATDF